MTWASGQKYARMERWRDEWQGTIILTSGDKYVGEFKIVVGMGMELTLTQMNRLRGVEKYNRNRTGTDLARWRN